MLSPLYKIKRGIEMGICEMLYDYQKKILNTFKDKSSLGLFLDMGLGKTPLSLAFCECNKINKIIVITINSKYLEKEDEVGSWKWWIKKSNINYKIKDKKDVEFNDENEFLIINYESLFSRKKDAREKVRLNDNINEFIKSCKNKKVAIILDESHKVKTSNSLQTLSVFKLQKELSLTSSSLHTYLLTGTPFTQSYLDLYTQLKLLGLNMTKTYFIDEYCVRANIAGLMGWQQPIVGYKNINELYRLIHKYAITIKSKEVLKLPKQVFKEFITPFSYNFNLLTSEKASEKIIKKELESRGVKNKLTNSVRVINNPFYRNIEYPSFEWLAETAGQMRLRCREMSIGFQGNKDNYKWYDCKRGELLKKFLEENRDNYVIFYNYTPELFLIYEIAEKLKYNIDIYCGEIKSLYFYDEYSKLKEEDKINHKNNIIISNFASGSTGMNWQLYNKCILFSIPLFKDYEQSLKRVHRVGQKEMVFYYIFYGNNFLDKSMLKALKENKQYDEKMFKMELNNFNNI